MIFGQLWNKSCKEKKRKKTTFVLILKVVGQKTSLKGRGNMLNTYS